MYEINIGRKLKPCPFCGGEAKAEVGDAGYGSTGVHITCSHCHSKTMLFIVGRNLFSERYSGLTETILKAAERWENRKSPATDQSTQETTK